MNTRQSNLSPEDLRVANIYVGHRSKKAECRMSRVQYVTFYKLFGNAIKLSIISQE
jgi:hypothetical protein